MLKIKTIVFDASGILFDGSARHFIQRYEQQLRHLQKYCNELKEGTCGCWKQ